MMLFGPAHIFLNQCWILPSGVSNLGLETIFELLNVSIFAKSISPLKKGDLVVNFALFEVSVEEFSSYFV